MDPIKPMLNSVNPLLVLLPFIICAAVSYLLCNIARIAFPKFRSGEHKPGTHRPDMPVGGREIKTVELPLVGGPAFITAMMLTGIVAGYLLHLDRDQWTLLLIGLGATLGYALIGFIDDWRKVYRNAGLAERYKFTGVFLVGMLAAGLYFFLLPSAKEAYGVYKDLPFLNTLLCAPHQTHLTADADACTLPNNPVIYYGWFVFLMFLTGVIGSLTSLSVDFSDGLDGLAGGLVFSAALAMGIVVSGLIGKESNGTVLTVLALLGAGAALGYLPWNWPSAWAARRGKASRRSKIIMGDCGALGLGGVLAITAIFSRNEWLLLMIGGAFVMEGLSVVISARVLTPFFRKHLQILRFASTHEFVPHTEFPLPFLATPLHHHFDLLGWDRRRLVYGAWALGACFAILGVLVNFAPFTWLRYIGRFAVIMLALIIWFSGSWSKAYFVGKTPAERTRRRRLALYYGYPFRIMGINLYHMVEIIEASEDVIETPAEELALWQRMTIYDARSMLGLYCYRAGYYPAALAQWTRIFERNRVLRPEIARLLAEVDNRLALEKQETQPMRRAQILRQEPILQGNLPPADLPNPYEPVSSEETAGNPLDIWAAREPASFITQKDAEEEDVEEQQLVTSPLQTDPATPATNGHSRVITDHAQPSVTLGTQSSPAQSTEQRSNWLHRRRHSTDK